MTQTQSTRGQLERSLSQNIQRLYSNQLGHQPGKVTCRLLDNNLTFIVENSILPAEYLLIKAGKEKLAKQFRAELGEVMEPEIKATIEQVLGVSVLDLFCDATLQTGRMGSIAILESVPQTRPNSRTKSDRRSRTNSDRIQQEIESSN